MILKYPLTVTAMYQQVYNMGIIKNALIFVCFVFVLLLIAFGASNGTVSLSEGTATNSADTNPPSFQLISSQLEYENGMSQVTGEVKSLEKIDYLEASAKFYNADGKVIYSSMTNILDLGAGETWDFTIYGPTEEVTAYNLTVKDTVY